MTHFFRQYPTRLLFISLCMALAMIFMAASQATAQTSNMSEKQLPDSVFTGLDYLIDRVQDREHIELATILPLLDFAKNTARTEDNWEVNKLRDATGAYFGYGIAAPMDRIVEYLYSPGLPPSIFHPSVVRVGKWHKHPTKNILELWQGLADNAVIAVYAQEMEENTPDVNTGGYYTYNTDRLFLLVNHEGEKYLLSISKQKDQSSVGRKGVVIGDDADWNYFYTDEQGLTKTGLGWVDSYMFDSFSVTVLSMDNTDQQRSQHLMFKWLRAGWAGMNMVRSEHIRNGCERYSQSLIKLMEAKNLPDIETLQAMSEHVWAMDDQELSQTLQPYIQNLRKISSNDSTLSKRSFQEILAQDDPLGHYSIYAKQSLVMKELLKTSIGIPALLTMSKDDVLVSFLR